MKISVYPIIYSRQKVLQRLLYLCSKSYRIELRAFFEAISDFDYVMIKLETPNTHRQFPHNYTIGTDIDIIASSDDFPKIKFIINQLNKHKKFNIKEISDISSFKLRYQFGKFLNLQFDVSASDESKLFLNCINNSTSIKGIKVPKIEYELIVRILEWVNHPKKNHHLEFIRAYRDKLDISLLKSYDISPDKIKLITNI